jgi:predicted nucleic acid-binding protein
MKAFDTDILTQILRGNPVYADRVAQIPVADQVLPIVAAEELLRGRFTSIRQAEAGKAKITIDKAYQLFEQTLSDIREFTILSHTPQAEAQYQSWRKQRLRGSTHDLRIAAICITHAVTLVTRNRRDFEGIPGLSVDFWE